MVASKESKDTVVAQCAGLKEANKQIARTVERLKQLIEVVKANGGKGIARQGRTIFFKTPGQNEAIIDPQDTVKRTINTPTSTVVD